MKMPKPFTAYLVSGIWADHAGQPSHYAVHKYLDPGVSGCKKFTLEELIDTIENSGKPVYVWGWDYTRGCFRTGRRVITHTTGNGQKIIWTEKREPQMKQLRHLIRLNWFSHEIENRHPVLHKV